MIEVSLDFSHRYVREFETLYKVRYCFIDIHKLLHYPGIVRRLGPLWLYICFEYEDLNGGLLRLIHGTHNIHIQIAILQNRFITMTKFIEKLPDGEI